MLVTYGTVNLLNQKNLYRELASALLRLFEYDYRLPKVSYLLHRIRQDRMRAQLQELQKNKVFSGFKDILSAVAGNILDVGLGMRVSGVKGPFGWAIWVGYWGWAIGVGVMVGVKKMIGWG